MARTAAGSRATLQIKVGSYEGNGVAGRVISGVGFRPDFVFIQKSESGSADGYAKFARQVGGLSKTVGSGGTSATGYITDVNSDGFVLGSQSFVNANTLDYTYIAIRGRGIRGYASGTYVGNATDNTTITNAEANFVPQLALVVADSSGVVGYWKTTTLGSQQGDFALSAGGTTNIKSFTSGGFILGSTNGTNNNGILFNYWLMEEAAGGIKQGTFTGNGTGQSITGLGFQPEVVIMNNITTTGNGCFLKSTYMAGALSFSTRSAIGTSTTGITSLDSDGFTVATDNAINKSGDTIAYIALKSGNYYFPV